MENSLFTTEEELAKAIETNNLEQVKLCLKKVNVNQFLKLRGELLLYWPKDTIYEETPLYYAAYKGHLEVIKLLGRASSVPPRGAPWKHILDVANTDVILLDFCVELDYSLTKPRGFYYPIFTRY